MEEHLGEGFVVDEPFSGMPGFVLGGYAAGILAARLGGSATVFLRAPLALGKRVRIDGVDPLLLTGTEGRVIAEAVPLELPAMRIPTVTVDDAAAASEGFAGHRRHLFPTCFCCGPARPVGTGLRIFPGAVQGGTVVAAAWTPAAATWLGNAGRSAPTVRQDPELAGSADAVPIEIIWSALDCPAIWALVLSLDPRTADEAVTGRLDVELRAPIAIGQTCVVTGWPLEAEGRKRIAAAAVLSAEGEPLVIARQTMVVTGRGVPLGLERWAGG